MEQRKRLKKIINWLIFSGVVECQNELAERLGYTKSYMSQALNGHENLSPRLVERLCGLDENLNFDWVMDGEGSMFVNNPFSEFSAPSSQSRKVVIDADVWEILKAQSASLASRDKQVAELISMLRDEIGDLKKGAVQKDEAVICADAG